MPNTGVEINSIEVVSRVENETMLTVSLTIASESTIEALAWLVEKLDEA